MNLPPALTWLQLFPMGTSCACATGPAWFREMLASRPEVQPPRALVAWERQWHELLADLPQWEGIAAINCSGVTIRRLEAAGFGYARRFAVLPNLLKPRWFIPLDSPAIASGAFSVYTPARRSARMKKSLARLAARLRVPFWYRDQIVIASRQPPPLENLLAGLFPGQPLRLGLSAGAPEPALNRKASAAVLDARGNVLAFVKIAGSEISRRILEHEAEVLPALAERGRLGMAAPKLLFAGDVQGRYLTVQTPLPGRPAPPRMTAAHQRFLATLRNGETKPAAQTRMVATLAERIAALPVNGINLGATLERYLPTLESALVSSTIVHGDFAPWNLRAHDGRISAFDWEYGEIDGLPLIDETHFMLQYGFLLHDWDVDRAAHCLELLADAGPLGLTPQQVRAIQVIYLLDNLTRLLGEGYDPDHEMVAWYRRLLLKLGVPSAESAEEVALV